MKKSVKSIFIFCLILLTALPINAFAAEKDVPQWQDAVFSEKELAEIAEKGFNYEAGARATGLIESATMGVSNDGTTFKILGELMCVDDVIKCGYKNIVVQRSTTLSPTGFSDYATYDDVYANSSYCIFAKSLTVPSGYYYRVCVTFYAREGIFSTQSIDGITNAVYI